MLFPWPLLLGQADIANIDQMAQRRDVDGLSAMLAPGSGNPFRILRTNGAYDTGVKGWRAVAAQPPSGDERFVVLTTPLAVEDIGELVFRRVGDRLQYVPETDDLGMRILRHRFDVRFSTGEKKAAITDRLELSRKSGRGAFLFRMSPNYRIGAILAKDGRTVPFAQAGGVVVLNRPMTMKTTYRIEYSGIVDQPGYAASIGPQEATLANDYWYPMIARCPAPYELTVHAPTGWTVVAQGEALLKDQSKENAFRFRMDLPVTFYSLSAGKYRKAEATYGGRTFRAWSARMSPAQLQAQAATLGPIVSFMEKKFGPWPFEGYGVLDSPNYGGGALEAYSYASYGSGLPEEDAHEPSHTVFGGVLGNDYLKSFWNESFAAFCEGFYGREAAVGNRDERRLAFIRAALPEPGYEDGACATSGAEDGPLASVLGYGKGALVLQMLEQTIGTDRFAYSVRRWRSSLEPGSLTGWEDYEKAVLAVAPDKPIRRFFDGWIRGKSIPTLSLRSVQRTQSGVRLSLRVSPSGFVFPLDVLLIGSDGSRSFRKKLVDATSPDVTLTFSTPKEIAKVSVDPWRRVLRHMPVDEDVPSLASVLPGMRTVRDPEHSTYLRALNSNTEGREQLLIGHPDTMPALRPLCKRLGFDVRGNKLEYKGTTIDLRSGGAIALVDLPGGGHEAIGIGTCSIPPNLGNARLIVFDRLGRFLRGATEPRTSGEMTMNVGRLPG